MVRNIKKLLAIIVLGLLFSGSANSQIIELKKCSPKYNPKLHIKWGFVINTDKLLLQKVVVYQDAHYEKTRKLLIERFGSTSIEKIVVRDFKIQYFDDRFVKAGNPQNNSLLIWEIDLKKKIVSLKMNRDSNYTDFQCR
jgi:hypothetical protein